MRRTISKKTVKDQVEMDKSVSRVLPQLKVDLQTLLAGLYALMGICKPLSRIFNICIVRIKIKSRW